MCTGNFYFFNIALSKELKGKHCRCPIPQMEVTDVLYQTIEIGAGIRIENVGLPDILVSLDFDKVSLNFKEWHLILTTTRA